MKAVKIFSISMIALLAVACSKVTQENYQKLENGMHLDDVQSIVGKADVMESTSLAGISTARAEWHGKDGTISIRFIEEKVRAKNWQAPTE